MQVCFDYLCSVNLYRAYINNNTTDRKYVFEII